MKQTRNLGLEEEKKKKSRWKRQKKKPLMEDECMGFRSILTL